MRYLQLAHNERNERGVPVARVVHNLGREDQLDREALVRLVGSIERFLGGSKSGPAARWRPDQDDRKVANPIVRSRAVLMLKGIVGRCVCR